MNSKMKERIESTIWTLGALTVGIGICGFLWLVVSVAVIVFEG